MPFFQTRNAHEIRGRTKSPTVIHGNAREVGLGQVFSVLWKGDLLSGHDGVGIYFAGLLWKIRMEDRIKARRTADAE